MESNYVKQALAEHHIQVQNTNAVFMDMAEKMDGLVKRFNALSEEKKTSDGKLKADIVQLGNVNRNLQQKNDELKFELDVITKAKIKNDTKTKKAKK